MAENKKSVLLYCDIIHTVNELSDDEAGKLFKHYLAYINDLNPIAPDKLTQIVFEPIKQNLKRDLKKWELIILKRSEAGKASAEKKKQNQQVLTSVNNNQHGSTNSTVIDTVTVTVKDTVKEINIINKWFSEFENGIEITEIARLNSLNIETVKLKLVEFRSKAELEYPTYGKFVSHFKNWLVKNKSNGNGNRTKSGFVC